MEDEIEVMRCLRMQSNREGSSFIISLYLCPVSNYLIHHHLQSARWVFHSHFEFAHLQQSVVVDVDELILKNSLKWFHLKE